MVQIKPQLMKSKSSTESAFFSSDSSIANKWKYWLTTDTKYIKLTWQDNTWQKPEFTFPQICDIHLASVIYPSWKVIGRFKSAIVHFWSFFFLEFLKKHFFDLHEALICFNKAYFKFFGVQILLTFQFFFHLNWRRGGVECQVYFKQHLKVSIW